MGCDLTVAKNFLPLLGKNSVFDGGDLVVAKSGEKFFATWPVLKPVLATTFRWNFNDQYVKWLKLIYFY